jgi:peptide/nickel transport system permease protein
MRVHVLSNVIGPVLVYATSLLSVSIILAARPVLHRPGRQAADARVGTDAQHPAQCHLHPAAAGGLPGVLIFLVSLGFNLLADGLRSAMEVK